MRYCHPIDISQISMDRVPINKETYELAKDIETNGLRKPIKVALVETGLRRGNFEIRDGRHRVTAMRLLGRTKIPAKYGVRDAI